MCVPEEAYAAAVRSIFSNADYSGAATRYKNPQECWTRFEALLDRLGRPGAALHVVHIAGTNGKGTTSALCEAMLRESGVRVGLFTSPHLHCFRERIRIDGALVSREAVVAGMARVSAAAEAVGGASPFEKLTALALLCFDAAGVSWAVLETGLGGRWDATNHFSPRVCGVTRVGLDHVNVLGSTVREIAGEKAGILKRGVPAFSVAQAADAAEVLRAAAAAAGTSLTTEESMPPLEASLPAGAAPPAWLSPPHQAANASLALAMVGSLAQRGLLPDKPAARGRALVSTRWPARYESLSPRALRGGKLLLDVAHNEPAVRALAAVVSGEGGSGDAGGVGAVAVVCGANRDKDLPAILRELAALWPRASVAVAVASSHPKATPAEEVARAGAEAGGAPGAGAPPPPWRTAASMLEALEVAAAATPPPQLVLCCGSVFVAAEMREALARAEPELFDAADWVFEASRGEPHLVM